MITFSQQDSRWANTKFGGGYTIGRYGCTVTDLTMIRDYKLGGSWTPDFVSTKLSFAEGLVVWSSLANIGLTLVERVFGRNDAKIAAAIAHPTQCVIIQVNNSHWVWGIGRRLPILGYKIVDPWDGRIKYTNAYGNNITGCAIIN